MNDLRTRQSRIILVLFALLLALGFTQQMASAVPVHAQVSTTVNVCGTVNAYTAAGVLTPGIVTIGSTTLPIAPGATLNGAALLVTGAHVCLSATVVAGSITSGTVTAQAGGTVSVCGTVSSYTAATALLPGLVVVNGQTVPIAAGATLNGAGLLTTGAHVCINGTLNASGQLSNGTVTLQGGGSVSVCGVVSAYTASSGTAAGSITIAGQTIPIAIGTTLNNANLITAGANLCLSGTLNGAGQISSGGVTANGGATVNVCGVVSAYTAATATAPGSVTINGQTIQIAAGANLTNANLITVNANVCVHGTLNAAGQLSNGNVTANATGGGSVNVCGVVTAYTAATATAPGSVTINGQTIQIAAGAALTGAGLLTAGANVCLQGSLNASGQLNNGTVTATASGSVSVCGVVTAYTVATASAPGSVTINGQTVAIAAGATLTNANLITINANICLQGTLNASGQVSNGSVTAQATGGATVSVCGTVGAYTAATATAPGSITINGQTITIAAGTALNGAGLIALGANLCLNGSLNAQGQLNNGTVTATVGATVNVCGVVTSYTAATASAPGSITIGGQTIPIAAGTTLTGAALIAVAANLCLQATLNASGQISSGGVTVSATATLTACGVVTAYTAATSSAPGSITIAGVTFVLAPGSTITGAVTVGSNLCLTIVLNGGGQVTGGTTGSNPGGGTTLTGGFTNYVPPTPTTPGSVTIGGITFPIAAGTQVTVSNPVPLAATPVYYRHASMGGLTSGPGSSPSGVELSY